jgi:pSer/pThr/pTyr-binding forkhead associated (FHA) protein
MNGDRIIVTEPNGIQRSRPITARGLTIGRGEDNDLVLSYDGVSRSHAVVTLNQGRYYVTDLNSANGTFVGELRVDPQAPMPWAPGQRLRIGAVSIQLQPARRDVGDPDSDTLAGFRLAEGQDRAAQGWGEAAKWLLATIAIALVLVTVLIVVLVLSR